MNHSCSNDHSASKECHVLCLVGLEKNHPLLKKQAIDFNKYYFQVYQLKAAIWPSRIIEKVQYSIGECLTAWFLDDHANILPVGQGIHCIYQRVDFRITIYYGLYRSLLSHWVPPSIRPCATSKQKSFVNYYRSLLKQFRRLLKALKSVLWCQNNYATMELLSCSSGGKRWWNKICGRIKLNIEKKKFFYFYLLRRTNVLR